MRFVFGPFAAGALAFGLATTALAEDAGQPDPVIYFFDRQSAALLDSAEKQDLTPLMSSFVSEYQATFCGIASAVMALNALGVSPPLAPQWYPYSYWDQDNIFSREVLETVKPVSSVNAEGVTLAELRNLLELNRAKVDMVYASDTDVDAFRIAGRAAIADPNAVLLVNFGRAALGQPGIHGGGHISPVAAYDEGSDRFLILDVARYKFPPSWVTAGRLYAAMNTQDASAGKSRGFLVVRK